MNKNVVLACGLGDLFLFLTKLDDFFEKNKEYTSIKFFSWIHSPELAKELVSMSKHNVSIYSVEDMTNYLRTRVSPDKLEQAETMFIKQNTTGKGVPEYMEFIHRFFPNLEQWVNIGVYNKYKSTYPYTLPCNVASREKPYIVVHPFSSSVKTEKEERTWSTDRWGSLLKQMREYSTDYEIVLIGSNGDKKINSKLFSTKGITDLRGELSLTESVALVQGASILVGINSWPAMMSYWSNIPTYVQWFVQEHFLQTHVPKEYTKMKHVHFELGVKSGPYKEMVHPTAAEVWPKIRDMIDAAITI